MDAMPERRNEAGREVWFDRILWSYWPCHWKGWALILATVVGGNLCIWTLVAISEALGQNHAAWPFLPLVPFVVWSWWISERHVD
jgi:hypothetical protein